MIEAQLLSTFRHASTASLNVIAIACTLLCGPAAAAEPALVVDGAVAHVLTLPAADLAALPQSDVHVAYLTGHGPEGATCSGVSLWSLIEKVGLGAALADRRTHTGRYLVLTARDGYQVALELGEIDRDLEGKPANSALKRDCIAIDAKDVFRLALAGGKHGARNAHGLAHIEL